MTASSNQETRYLQRIPHALNCRVDPSGDIGVINEVMDLDCYNMLDFFKSGFQPKNIIDVGAHIGAFAVLAQSLFPEARIFCIEPNIDNLALLRKNVAHGFVIEGAVDYGDKPLRMTSSAGSTGSGFVAPADDVRPLMEIKSRHDGAQHSLLQQEVTRVTIEEIVSFWQIESIDLLKMDCEGGEWGIAEHLSNDIAKSAKCIKGEYHTFNGRTLAEFKQLLGKKFPHLQFLFDEGLTHGVFHSF